MAKPRRMTDEEVEDYVHGKLFGDMDQMEADAMFNEKDPELEVSPNAKPEPNGVSGVSVEIKPLMAAAENGKPKKEDEEDDDRLKGIGGMSPLMEQLHGER